MAKIAKKLKGLIKDRALRLVGLELKADYVTSVPSAQNSLDLFKGEWASRLPPPFENLAAGDAELFNDTRIAWLGQRIDNVTTARVLECGPLEAGHTYSLEKLGIASIDSIEASSHAFLRCLVVKEIVGLQRSHFLLGDFVSHLRTGKHYDLILACGVLYHLVNPVEAIALMAKATDQLYIWTQYYDEAIVKTRPILAHHFQSSLPSQYAGFPHTLHRQVYQTRLGNAAFMGGSEAYSHWLSRADLLGALNFFGFDNLEIQFDDHEASSGPNISLMAKRRRH
jgi:hypothetical protein